MKSINTFADHAPKIEWIQNFFEKGNEFFTDNTLGPMQISMFKRFLSDAKLAEKNKTTQFYDVITRLGWESEEAWGLILVQLAYQNPQIKWYIDNMPINETFPRQYLEDKLHELRDDTTYRSIVDALVVVPAGADTRDTEAVKRIATAYLKLLFPNVKKPEDIDSRDFNRYCLRRACNMRATIKMQLGIMDSEYRGKDIPAFKVAEIN